MDPTIANPATSSGSNLREHSRSTFETLRNVFALLDEDRSRQLLQRVIPAVTYTGTFDVIGRDDGLDPPTELCSPCKNLMLRPPPMHSVASWVELQGTKDFAPARCWMPHHDTLFQLIDCCFSRSGKCRLCQLLWHGIRRQTLRHRSSKITNQRIGWHTGGLKVALQSVYHNMFFIGLNIEFQPFHGHFKNFSLRMVHKPDADAVEFRPMISKATDSASTFDQIKTWINHCQRNHSLCQITSRLGSKRPTRLILISESADTFSLTTVFPPDARYATVSYRWGGGEGCYMLRRDTEERMREGVSLNVLPKTLLDTIIIAHGLGFKYIWIDRLCIFQDSRDDWSREASRMAFIYQHAFLSISASCASHDNQGCFRKRNAGGIQPLWLTSNPLLPSLAGISGEKSYITSDMPLEDQKYGGKLGHLADRGWVFQERMLSQRIIHFAEEEVHWECRELEASEAWPGHTESFTMPRRPSILGQNRLWHLDQHTLWHEMVESYSACEFTHDGDKLPALSGLARDMAELRSDNNDEYVVGLWRSNMQFDLCWADFYDTASTPERYLAPSWSWASLHGRIIHYVTAPRDEHVPAAEFKDARLQYTTLDPYGAVDDGWIHLFGYLKPVMVVRRRDSAVERQKHWSMEILDTDGNSLPFVDEFLGKLDVQYFAAGDRRSVPIFCLPMVKSRVDDARIPCFQQVFCLLLAPKGSIKYVRSGKALPSPETEYADEYQRIGLAQLAVPDSRDFEAWLAKSPGRDIVIR